MDRNLTMAIFSMELENYIVIRDNKISGVIGMAIFFEWEISKI